MSDIKAITTMIIAGHRGAAALAPENTLAGIRLAATTAATGIEIDTQLSADGIPVVFHDESVKRCTNGSGNVSSMTLTQLQSLDAGSWFDPRFAAQTIPSLEQAMQQCLASDLILNLELKIHHTPEAIPLVNAVAALVERINFPADKLILSSFEIAALEQCQRVLPDVRRGYICEDWSADQLDTLKPLDLFSVHMDHHILTPAVAASIKAANLQLQIWTMNDPAQKQRFADMGVDVIITDCPDQF